MPLHGTVTASERRVTDGDAAHAAFTDLFDKLELGDTRAGHVVEILISAADRLFRE